MHALRLRSRRWITVFSLGLLAGLMSLVSAAPASAATSVFINEIHYDNTGTDAGEAIEVAGPAGTDLTGWDIVLYNGSNGEEYDTDALTGTIPDLGSGFGVVVMNYAANGIQNGAPDGIALVDASDVVVQFLSYEGTLTAVEGPATGMLSTDIGVDENGSEPLGQSLQLTGTGTMYEDFTWAEPAPSTFGAFNNGQTFGTNGGGDDDTVINEFVFNHVGTDTNEYIEIFGEPETDLSNLTILEIEGDATSTGTIDAAFTVGTTDAAGFWVTPFLNNELENGTVTLLLVDGFTGAAADDLDTDDDGVLDTMPWTAIVDGLAVTDDGTGDLTYTVPVLTEDFDGGAMTVGGASRIPDGADTDTAADWVRNDFDGEGLPGFTGTPMAGEAVNTPGTTNFLFEPPPFSCDTPATLTLISTIQGDGATSPLEGQDVVVEAAVTAVMPGLSGFYIQEEPSDDDGSATTSEGIFVFTGTTLPDGLAVGDVVRVDATVTEFETNSGESSLTELTAPIVAECVIDPVIIAATELVFPVAAVEVFEQYEGMLTTLPQDLVISEYFNFDRFNEVVVALPLPDLDRLFTPTAVVEPGPEAVALAAEYELRWITIDDGRSTQNPDPAIHPGNGAEFDLNNRFRGGDTIGGITGVIDDTFGVYRVQPTVYGDYTVVNPRPAAPDEVGGRLQVAAMNQLNYFLTIDTGADICGPDQNQECRGADDAEELERQRTKLLAALVGLDADVIGLNEIENTPGVTPEADLASGLNDVYGAGTYDYIDTGVIGTDAIRVGIIYRTTVVTPAGAHAILDSSVDPRFLDDQNRPVLAQTFEEIGTEARFTVAVNHLKSKGSDCDDIADPDTGDGQGNCNLTRTAAAEALVDWLATDPTDSGDGDALIIGDLNSYDKEDPIDAIIAGPDDTAGSPDDYTDLIRQFLGEYAYTYLFDAQFGYLDYALASATMEAQVTGAAVWHINADEPDILDYDTTFKLPAQDALYEPNAYRSSDHDPVIVGLNLLKFDFGGFLPPIDEDNQPNMDRAGSVLPLRFSLGGFFGLDILVDGYPAWQSCSGGPLVPATVQRELRYNVRTDLYQIVLRTSTDFAGTCQILVVAFTDGTIVTVTFEFF